MRLSSVLRCTEMPDMRSPVVESSSLSTRGAWVPCLEPFLPNLNVPPPLASSTPGPSAQHLTVSAPGDETSHPKARGPVVPRRATEAGIPRSLSHRHLSSLSPLRRGAQSCHLEETPVAIGEWGVWVGRCLGETKWSIRQTASTSGCEIVWRLTTGIKDWDYRQGDGRDASAGETPCRHEDL